MTTEIKPFVREIDPAEFDKRLAEVKLIPEPGMDHHELNLVRRHHRRMCVMQLIAFITGQVSHNDQGEIDGITYNPICVSEIIAGQAMLINDSTGERTLQKFLNPEFLQKLMGTAPIAEKITRRTRNGKETVTVTQVVVKGDPRYREAEKKRKKMVSEKCRAEMERRKKNVYDEYDWFEDQRVKIEEKMAFLVELAEVARFDAPELLPCAIINGKIQTAPAPEPEA